MGSRKRFVSFAAFALLASLTACGAGGGGDGSGGGRPGTIAQDLASVHPNPEWAAKFSQAGSFAADYLRGANFGTLYVEVDYPASRPPTPEVLDLLRQRLLQHCDKLDVVVVTDDAIPDSRFPAVLSVGDVHEIEDEFRDIVSDEATGTAAAYVLYTLGHSDDDGGGGVVLGIAHRGGSVVLFVENADDSGGAFFSGEEFEGHGLVHELGHLLGLVNGGVPMVDDHEDPQHPYHTANPDCVMYWAIGGGLDPLQPHLGQPGFAAFGPESTADMQAFGGN